MNLSLGVDGGIYSYIFFASAISSGTSFLVFDGNAGIGLELFDAHSIDLSITQFSNTEYNENRIQYIHLPRDINLAYTFLKEINPEVHLKALAWGRLNQDAYYANINGVLTYVNLFGGSWGIDSHKVSTIGFNFFIKDYEEKRLGFYLNYNLPLTDVIVNVSPIELSLALTPKN